MNDHRDDTLLDKAKRLFGMDDGHESDAPSRPAAATQPRGDEHGELVGQPHGPDEGHFINDPPLEERPSLHPTATDAGVSDAARAARSSDVLDDPGLRREGFTETGAASGKVAMPGGEEPVVGGEDREDVGRLP